MRDKVREKSRRGHEGGMYLRLDEWTFVSRRDMVEIKRKWKLIHTDTTYSLFLLEKNTNFL